MTRPHFILFDFETTGFPNRRPDCPVRGIQMGMALTDGLTVLDSWKRVINPPVWPAETSSVYQGALAIHGLTKQYVQMHGVDSVTAWRDFERAVAVWSAVAGVPVGTVPLLAWNAKFDTEILHRFGGDAGVLDPCRASRLPTVRLPTGRGVFAPDGCLMRGFQQWAPLVGLRPEKKGLNYVCGLLGIPKRDGHHDAEADAVLTAQVLVHMLSREIR